MTFQKDRIAQNEDTAETEPQEETGMPTAVEALSVLFAPSLQDCIPVPGGSAVQALETLFAPEPSPAEMAGEWTREANFYYVQADTASRGLAALEEGDWDAAKEALQIIRSGCLHKVSVYYSFVPPPGTRWQESAAQD